MCLINQNLIEEANNEPSMLCCDTQSVILFTFNSIISIVRLSEDIYNNTNEDSYNIFKHVVTMLIHLEHFKLQSF